MLDGEHVRQFEPFKSREVSLWKDSDTIRIQETLNAPPALPERRASGEWKPERESNWGRKEDFAGLWINAECVGRQTRYGLSTVQIRRNVKDQVNEIGWGKEPNLVRHGESRQRRCGSSTLHHANRIRAGR